MIFSLADQKTVEDAVNMEEKHQCRYCHYWHDDIIDEESGLKWAPFCDLFHGNGLAYPCDQFITSEEYLSLIQALKDASKHPSVKFDIKEETTN